MNIKKHTLKHTLEHFSISRSTLYKTLRNEGISTIKEGRTAYISNTDFAHLENTCFLGKKNMCHETDKNTRYETQGNTDLIDHLRQQIDAEQKKNEDLRAENKNLIKDVGRWEGVARTLQDQNQKLLELKPEEESEIEEAEIIEPKPSEEKADKKGFFQKLFNFKQ